MPFSVSRIKAAKQTGQIRPVSACTQAAVLCAENLVTATTTPLKRELSHSIICGKMHHQRRLICFSYAGIRSMQQITYQAVNIVSGQIETWHLLRRLP